METVTDTAAAASEATATRRIDQLLEHYGESHRNPRNEVIHFVAIPLIVLSLLGLISALHPWLPYVVVALSLVYYARLSLTFLAAMAIVSAVCLALVEAMGPNALAISAALFVGSWIAQFVGHRIEGKKPSFFEDLQYLLIGPLFVLSKLFLRLGFRW